jgi:hypothetical protein
MNLDSVPNWLRPTKVKIATSLLALSGLMGFASIAISGEEVTQAATAAATSQGDEISNGSVLDLGDGLSIAPIAGWKIERKSMGMSLVMKEVLPAQIGEVDYSKPVFARNLTVMTLPEARPIDDASVEEMKTVISKMFARDPSLKDVTFTEHKFFDYKGKNDGLILFSQLTVNNYQMMQMQVVVSGGSKSYLMTYSDIASNFSNPASYDAAWKSMASIQVSGLAPKRFEKEMMIGGAFGAALLAIIVPFLFIRWYNARRIRKFADELQYDWDTGAMKSDNDYELSDFGALDQTRPAHKMAKAKKAEKSGFDFDVSALSNISAISTRHSRFA